MGRQLLAVGEKLGAMGMKFGAMGVQLGAMGGQLEATNALVTNYLPIISNCLPMISNYHLLASNHLQVASNCPFQTQEGLRGPHQALGVRPWKLNITAWNPMGSSLEGLSFSSKRDRKMWFSQLHGFFLVDVVSIKFRENRPRKT